MCARIRLSLPPQHPPENYAATVHAEGRNVTGHASEGISVPESRRTWSKPPARKKFQTWALLMTPAYRFARGKAKDES